MKKLLITLVLVLTYVNSWASVSQEAAYKIFKKLARKSGHTMLFFKIDSSGDVQATASPFTITVYQGMLNFASNENQLALVIGHEIGHVATGFRGEYQADMYGFTLLNGSGYSACSSLSFMVKMRNTFGDLASATHPKWSDRYNRLIGFCK